MSENPQFFRNPFQSTFCEMFNCRTVSPWLIGRPVEGALVMPGSMRLCDPCARSVAENLPDELLAHVNIERAFELMDPEKRLDLLAALADKYFPDQEQDKEGDAVD